MPLPSGDLTFLFTDIEGSTRLWEEDPDAMSAALAWHDDLLQATLAAHGGLVFKKVGDAFCAAFPSSDAAAAAAVEVQRALSDRLRVRIALHRGPAERRDGDFFGPTLNRVARLLATGHGGQTLLSDAARESVAALPDGASLTDLGLHGLKDLQRPERVWELRHAELPFDHPPLRSLNVQLHNLPTQLTSFIGREAEMAALRELMERHRLVTVTGSGGCGKTRLTLQIAADSFDAFADGVWLAELAPIQDPTLVVSVIADALQVRQRSGQTLRESLLEVVSGRTLLLVIDNCEHLVASVASLVDALLRASPGLRILATSRELLGVQGERAYRVPSLNLPEADEDLALERLARYDGVRLFLDRAAAVAPAFAPTPENASALVSVCRRLDGIPLAIELAAARVRALPVEQLAERLDDRFRLLTGGSRTAVPRQQTLRALVDWSYNLLDPREQALLRHLAAFVGGWTLEAAEAVGADEGAGIEGWEVVDLLTSLVDKSLVVYEEDDGRYRLLETVRHYAIEQLERDGAGAVRLHHRAFFADLARTAEPELMGRDQRLWLDRVQVEHDNLRAALDHCEREGDGKVALEICTALERFWNTRGHWAEGRRRIAAALALPGAAGEDRAVAIHCAALLASSQGDWDAADALLRDAVAAYRELGEERKIAVLYGHLGVMGVYRSRYDEARRYFDESLRMQRADGRTDGVAAILLNLGELERRLGNLEAARAHFEESLPLWTELGHWHPVAIVHNNLARVAGAQGRFGDAWRLAHESLRVRSELQDRQGIVLSLEAMASIASAQSRHADALALLTASQALQDSGAFTLSPQERAEHESRADAARAALEAGEGEAASRRGAGLSLDQAIALGLSMGA